jgi:hypothetical protein
MPMQPEMPLEKRFFFYRCGLEMRRLVPRSCNSLRKSARIVDLVAEHYDLVSIDINARKGSSLLKGGE